MPLDFFARKQALTCQVVAKRKETSWNPPALCLRLLLPDGSELEGQFVREAMSQFEALPLHVSYSMDVLRHLGGAPNVLNDRHQQYVSQLKTSTIWF